VAHFACPCWQVCHTRRGLAVMSSRCLGSLSLVVISSLALTLSASPARAQVPERLDDRGDRSAILGGYESKHLVASQASDPEALFGEMEKKLSAAKSVKVAFSAEGRVASGIMKGKGSWILAKGNKARLELERTAGGRTLKRLQISDGVNVFEQSDEQKRKGPTPANLHQVATSLLNEVGPYNAMFSWPSDFKQGSAFARYDFKLAADETIGTKKARVIEYSLKDKNGTLKCKLWLDAW
jgi:outer membrane lipoprotein-sorting protein